MLYTRATLVQRGGNTLVVLACRPLVGRRLPTTLAGPCAVRSTRRTVLWHHSLPHTRILTRSPGIPWNTGPVPVLYLVGARTNAAVTYRVWPARPRAAWWPGYEGRSGMPRGLTWRMAGSLRP